MSQVPPKESQSAMAHKDYIMFVLNLFQNSALNVLGIITDNSAVSLKLSYLRRRPIMVCASQRWNLAFNDLINSAGPVLEKVRGIMKYIRRPICAAKLQENTDLYALLD